MCGLAGFIDLGQKTPDPERTLRQMAAPMARRGPDDEGILFDPSHKTGLSHRRLAVLDLSPTGHQPMTSRSGRFSCAYNGEIYNFADLRAELEKNGQRFRGTCDTEVLLEAIEHWGLDEAVGRLNGMFAFAVLDREQARLALVRDRLGIKPLHYATCGNTQVFGSDIRAIQAHPAFSSSIDPSAAALFLRHGYIPGPMSIFQDISKVEPGTIVEFSTRGGRSEQIRRYWSALDFLPANISESDVHTSDSAVEALEPILRSAVKARLVSDVPIGTFLSGGIDSPLVTSLAAESLQQPLNTFNMGFQDPSMDESGPASRIAEHLGTNHHSFQTTPDEVLSTVEEIPHVYDEPFADSSAIPTLLLSKGTRQHVTVCLSGDGGDELFFGYQNHLLALKTWSKLERIPLPLRHTAGHVVESIANLLNRPCWASAGQQSKIDPSAEAHRLHGIATFLKCNNGPGFYRELVSIWKDPIPILNSPVRQDSWITRAILRDAAPQLKSFMPLADLLGYLPDDILTKVDRASMHHSLEVRVPILDHRVVEFALQLPHEVKFNGKQGKLPLRHLLQKRVPPRLTSGPKRGFAVPLNSWLRGPLRSWAEDLIPISRPAGAEYLDWPQIRATWEKFLRNPRMSPFHCWNILMLLQWQRAGRH